MHWEELMATSANQHIAIIHRAKHRHIVVTAAIFNPGSSGQVIPYFSVWQLKSDEYQNRVI